MVYQKGTLGLQETTRNSWGGRLIFPCKLDDILWQNSRSRWWITEEFLRSLKPKSKTLATFNFRGLTLRLTPQLISRVTDLPKGVPWDKEETKLGQKAKKEFFLSEEQFSEDKNGVRRTSLQPFWSKVSLQIMKYITCEGQFSIVYGYHF